MSSEETLQIKRLTLDATLPTRASPGSVGYDFSNTFNFFTTTTTTTFYHLYPPCETFSVHTFCSFVHFYEQQKNVSKISSFCVFLCVVDQTFSTN